MKLLHVKPPNGAEGPLPRINRYQNTRKIDLCSNRHTIESSSRGMLTAINRAVAFGLDGTDPWLR